jgi:two-component system CheB/CheR fusion protein
LRHERDELFALIAHDLRNPLNTVSMRTQLLSRSLPEGDHWHELRKHVDVIDAAGRSMELIIDSLLDLASIEAGNMELDASRHDLVPILQAVRVELASAASAKGIHFTVDVPNHALAVRCDRKRIHNVLFSLMQTAIHETPKGGAVTVDARSGHDAVQVSVRDGGSLVGPEFLAQLSNRYYRAPQTRGRAQLGLFVARGIIEAHQGQLSVDSGEQGGNTLSFTLPFAASEFVPARKEQHLVPSASEPRQVLIVDDCHDSADLLATFLSRRGYPVRVAYDGVEALDQLEEQPTPEVVVLDLSLPQIDGFKIAQIARARLGEDARVIALTGLSSNGDGERARRAGCDTVLSKPCPLTQVYAAITSTNPVKVG